MTFKELVEQDVINVFQNIEEFAEQHNVYYDEHDFGILPVILDMTTQKERERTEDDHRVEVFVVDATFFCAFAHMKCVPEKGHRIWIDDVEYRIAASSCEMGQIELGLRRYDE